METLKVASFDRLTTLMERFTLQLIPADPERATLVASVDEAGMPSHILFGASGIGRGIDPGKVLLSVAVDWGGVDNPLMAALPKRFEFALAQDVEMASVVGLMRSELIAGRCGAASVINRLGEVLIVRLLRAQIEAGSAGPGLIAGLSDPRLSRAIVAMHDQPGLEWRNRDLAVIAGLSLSRFAETFMTLVGETPAAYLRRWRLSLARQDILKGDRVDAVARRYGYGSPEGFARAFRQRYGRNPLDVRLRAPNLADAVDK
ncbi:AraC family transcriptional regulator [Hoeflea sp.]